MIHQNDLVELRIALDAVAEFLETDAGALGFERFVEHVVNQRGFAGTGDAGHGDHGAEREHHVDIAQVVRARAKDAQKTARRLAPQRRNGNAQFAVEITRGERVRRIQEMLARAAKKQLAAQFAGARSEVEHVIGGGDGFGIVLDDEDGVSQIAQAFENFDQPVRIARMQADGRLIEHVERADQLRAQRRGQLDALRLAAGKRGGEAIEREIVEPHLIQKAQPLLNLLQDSLGDGSRFRRQFERVEKLARLGDGQRADFGNRFSLDAHGASFGAQPRATAFGASGVAAIAAEEDAHVQLVFFSFEPGEKAIDAGKVGVSDRPR